MCVSCFQGKGSLVLLRAPVQRRARGRHLHSGGRSLKVKSSLCYVQAAQSEPGGPRCCAHARSNGTLPNGESRPLLLLLFFLSRETKSSAGAAALLIPERCSRALVFLFFFCGVFPSYFKAAGFCVMNPCKWLTWTGRSMRWIIEIWKLAHVRPRPMQPPNIKEVLRI